MPQSGSPLGDIMSHLLLLSLMLLEDTTGIHFAFPSCSLPTGKRYNIFAGNYYNVFFEYPRQTLFNS
jgi:hypothetical protein